MRSGNARPQSGSRAKSHAQRASLRSARQKKSSNTTRRGIKETETGGNIETSSLTFLFFAYKMLSTRVFQPLLGMDAAFLLAVSSISFMTPVLSPSLCSYCIPRTIDIDYYVVGALAMTCPLHVDVKRTI